jgi:electron transport complex protein RnfC
MSDLAIDEPSRSVEPPALADAKFEEWIPRIRRAGINALRSASPDLLRQLERAATGTIDAIVCSVVDTDPTVPFNISVVESFPHELAAGLDLLANLTRSPRTWVAADPAKPVRWFTAVKPRVQAKGLRLMPVRSDYPQSDPTLMLFSLLDLRLKPGQLPTDKRVLLLDAAAAVALGRLVLYDRPHKTTPFALRDHFSRATHLLTLPIGARIGDICRFLGIDQHNHRFRGGDFLRDLWLDEDAPVGTGELVVHSTAIHLDANPDPCIRCGWCVEACPMRIHPAGLLEMAQEKDRAGARCFGLDACIECGVCTYVCPTRLPLLAAIRGLRMLPLEDSRSGGAQ